MPAMFIEQVQRPGVVGRLDPRTKLLLLVTVSVLIFVWESLALLGGLLIVVLALALVAGIPGRLIATIFLVMLPAIALVMAIQGPFSPLGSTPLLTWPDPVPWLGGRVALYREGVWFGLIVACRLLIPILAFPILVMTTEVNDLVTALTRARVPFKVAFLISTTLRFVPFIFAELQAIRDAQRLRGVAIESMGLLRRAGVFARMLVPLILGSLMKAQTLEMALQARAFSGSRERTYLNADAVRLKALDVVVMIALVLLLTGAVAGRLAVGWGGFDG